MVMALPVLVCVVMLLILVSLARHNVPGVVEWQNANIMMLVALIGYALWPFAPAFVTVVLANTAFMFGMLLFHAGCRRFFGLCVSWPAIAGITLFTAAAMAWLLYGYDDIRARIVVTSALHMGVCAYIGLTIRRHRPPERPPYTYLLSAGCTFLLAGGHAVRMVTYAAGLQPPQPLQESTGVAAMFLGLGVIGIAFLTMCFIIMTHDRLLAISENMLNQDHLTGVGSRKALLEQLAAHIAQAAHTGAPFALLLVDIDHFKKINDTHGHAAGDAALVHFVQLARACLRPTDFLGRLGGEEFAVLMPNTDPAAAQRADARLRAALAGAPCVFQGATIAFRYSGGLAAHRAGDTVASLMARADERLYAAKRQGRNRTLLASAKPAQETGADAHTAAEHGLAAGRGELLRASVPSGIDA